MALRPRLTAGLPFRYINHYSHSKQKGKRLVTYSAISDELNIVDLEFKIKGMIMTKRKNMRTRLALYAILMLSSCTPHFIPQPDPTQIALTSPPPSEIQPTIAPTPGDTPNMTPLPSFPATPNLQSLIEKANDDLAQRLSISTTQINVVDAKDVTCSNSSLGCPQPGMLYAEVLTPGFLVLLSANAQNYEYHAGKGSDVFYCENPLPPVEGMPGNT